MTYPKNGRAAQQMQRDAAIRIQRCFRGHIAAQRQAMANAEYSQLFIDIGVRNIILQEMLQLNRHVKHSSTAHHANYELAAQLFDKTEMPELKEQLKQYLQCLYTHQPTLNLTPEKLALFNTMLNEADCQTSENILAVLQTTYITRNLTCVELAMVLAIFLRDNIHLPTYIKDNINICQLDGHIFICLGSPDNKNNFILDPWIKYLDLPAVPQYRAGFIGATAVDRERGFMGTVEQYEQFLRYHPNPYIAADSDFMIRVHQNFTENTKPIRVRELQFLETAKSLFYKVPYMKWVNVWLGVGNLRN
jgi:hypothetical protein